MSEKIETKKKIPRTKAKKSETVIASQLLKEKLTKKLDRIDRRMSEPGFWKTTTLLLFGVIILTQVLNIKITLKPLVGNTSSSKKEVSQETSQTEKPKIDAAALTSEVIPTEGVILPIKWGDLGRRMILDGVIDEKKFRALFEGGLNNVDEQILTGKIETPILMNQNNSRFVLDVLWAFGLANKNEILEKGEMVDKKYGGDASQFASTGGWSLAVGKGFDHYSKHVYLTLDGEQQALVDKVSRNIFRPCCGNSTHFPDCNHGMAMLGLLELMVANGVGEQELYQVALSVNSLWFPQTYIDLATYFKEQGQDWTQIDPQTVLSAEYSSAQGYQTTRQKIESLPKPQQGGGGCGA